MNWSVRNKTQSTQKYLPELLAKLQPVYSIDLNFTAAQHAGIGDEE
jgi:hypothetical protein